MRHIIENTEGWNCSQGAVVLWPITGEPEPSTPVLEESVLPIADGGDDNRAFGDALGIWFATRSVTLTCGNNIASDAQGVGFPSDCGSAAVDF
ncbi:hypothetical protein [Streptomyces sp. NL15-2K]|uniref:hypothetical protein n=1 Tax=Streptomyces sp. NL15-2K TaxID=376149 RepID=UPI000F55D5D8|nr:MULTISPECIES: hypothetical protein [Actinomycetes]WKX15814.1 hypothetical protein Q4V64_53315 [Kutzneria buriramensis]GCB42794.1 hypothetical protein SNL152K_77 [Streptomyces sp. NL15-2K]